MEVHHHGRSNNDGADRAGCRHATRRTDALQPHRGAFAEGTYEIATGEPARMVVHNRDGFVHDITIPERGVDKVTVLPGRDAVVDVPAPAAGAYTVYCTLHSDLAETDPEQAGMAALLVVE